jgi:hypothetical protein
MIIYDLIHYDDVDMYMREDITQEAWGRAQRKLSKWFPSEEFTDELFLELIKMKTFKLQNGKNPRPDFMESFKEFMCNYYLDNPNITKKSFDITINFLKQSDNFRQNTDNILQSKFCTEEIFNYAIDNEYLGSDKNTLSHLFSNVKMSTETLLKYIGMGYSSKWDSMIRLQKLSKKVIDEILAKTKVKTETIFLLAEYKHEVDTTLFLNTLDTYKPDETWENPAKGIKQMILKDRNLFDDVFLWKPIFDFINGKASTQDKAIIYHAIFKHKNVSKQFISELIELQSGAIQYIVDRMNINNIHETNRAHLYELTNMDAFLSDEAKDLFLF